jgi:rare lipoprotein A
MKTTILTVILMCSTLIGAQVEQGKASFYSVKCNGGTHTASGVRLVDSSMTAAHRTLPFGTLVKVTNTKNNKSEIVKITNRGPFIRGRIIDVTIGVAKKLDFIKSGITPVKIEVVGKTKIK